MTFSSSRTLPGPAVAAQELERLRREPGHRAPEAGRRPGEEVPRELLDVPGPLAERRQPDRDDVEAVVQVLAEAPFPGDRGEVAVRRGDEPHVHLHRLLAADALEAPLLQDPQELHLHGGRQLADLVEEERPLVGELEPPELPPDRAGERAALVAEELGLEEPLRDRRARDRDEGLLAAGRAVVDRARDELLAGPGLAEHEDRRVGGGDLADLLEHPVDRLARADEPVGIARPAEVLLERLGAGAGGAGATALAARSPPPSRPGRGAPPGEKGFSRKSIAPSRMASTAVAIVPCAETTTTVASGSTSRSRRTTSIPSTGTMLRSVTTTSAGRLR